jgi:hypothetical protein
VEDGELTSGEIEVLINGLDDDISFLWVLIDLGIVENPPGHHAHPSAADVDAAFVSLRRLVDAGLISVGHLEYIDGGPPGRVAPVRHLSEPLDVVHQRTRDAIASSDWADWAFACWTVTTEQGSEVARRMLGSRDD